MKYQLSASLICADPLDLANEVKKLEGQIDYLHFDLMDGNFVPRYGLYPEILSAIKKVSKIPVDVHMMSEEPERYIDLLAKAGADIVCVHVEACRHLHRTIKLIKDAGLKVGVALNYATPLNILDYILDDIDLIMLMAINPGIVGHKLIPGAIRKINDLKNKLTAAGQEKIIEIDGGVSPESAAEMIKAGANILVCGTSAIFKVDRPVNEVIKEFREIIDRKISLLL